ncbi:hypothetical protein [Hyphomicrobium sp.]|jgi:hypothetical protein|uniref:hypothetical protein n=1 Tax=Hyphomicrobium sp. TaxID=82 RepID=UPI002D810908|nr:hypothetical protein [Hyphomicrobium sp.]
MLLTVMAVAGLPVIVCVSEAHGTAVELGGLYTAHHDSSEPHGAVSDSSDDAFGSGCTDFRLDRGILVEQVRLKQPTGLPILNNDGPAFSAAPASLLPPFVFADGRGILRVNRPVIRSSLSDLRTIVLLI